MTRKYRGFTLGDPSTIQPSDMRSMGVMHPRPAEQTVRHMWILKHDSDAELTASDLTPVKKVDDQTMRTASGLLWRRYIPESS